MLIQDTRDQVVHRLAIYNERIRNGEEYAKYRVLGFLTGLIVFTTLIFIITCNSVVYAEKSILSRLGESFLISCFIMFLFGMAGGGTIEDNQALTIYLKPEAAGNYARRHNQPEISVAPIMADDTILNSAYEQLLKSQLYGVDVKDVGILTIARLKTLALANINSKDITVNIQ